MFLSCYSEVLTIQEVIAAAKDGKSSEAHFVLLTHIAHIEELLVVEDEELSLAIDVRCCEDRGEGPPNEFFDHHHTAHARDESEGKCVGCSSHIHIVAVLSLSHIHPIFLNGRLVVIHTAVEYKFGEEAHTEINGCLMLSRNSTMEFVEIVEVISGNSVCSCSNNI